MPHLPGLVKMKRDNKTTEISICVELRCTVSSDVSNAVRSAGNHTNLLRSVSSSARLSPVLNVEAWSVPHQGRRGFVSASSNELIMYAWINSLIRVNISDKSSRLFNTSVRYGCIYST